MANDMASVEGWQWDQVEHGQDDVDQDSQLEHFGERAGHIGAAEKGRNSAGGAVQDEGETDNGDKGGEEIADWSSDSGENIVANKVLEVATIDRGRLGISKRGKAEQYEHCGQKNCAEEVYMDQRI